jgi:hypothetical protein
VRLTRSGVVSADGGSLRPSWRISSPRKVHGVHPSMTESIGRGGSALELSHQPLPSPFQHEEVT